MAVSKQEILDFLSANPNMSDADIASAMQQYGVSPAQMAAATGLSVGEVTARLGAVSPPDQAVLYGDTYVQPVYSSQGSGETYQQGPLENVISYKADENKVGGNIVQYDPSGNYEQTTQQQKVASFAGGLGEMLNDPFIQTALLTMGVGGGLGNALGLTGSTAQAVGTGLFKGGSALAGGADLEDALKVGLITGGLSYGGGELNKAIKYQDVPVDFNTMSTEQINQAIEDNFRNDLAKAGLSSSQINSYLANPASVYDASLAVTPEVISAPTSLLPETPEVTAPQVDTRSLLSDVAQTPVTETVNVTSAPIQQIDKAVVDLINNQIAANVATPIPTVTEQVVTSEKPVTVQNVVDSITAAVPTITPTEAKVIAEQVVTAEKPVTTQDVIDAIPVTTPTVTPTITPEVTTPEQVITAEKPMTIQDVIDAVTNIVPTTPVVTPNVVTPEQVITAEKPVTVEDVVNSIVSTIPTTPVVTPEQVITAEKPVTTKDVIDQIVASIPTTPTVPTQVITADKPITTKEVIDQIISSIPTISPEVTVTAEKPITTKDVIDSIIASIPTITPTPDVVTEIVPEVKVTAPSTPKLTDVISTIISSTPTITATPTPTPTVVEKPTVETKPDPLKVAQTALQAVSLMGAGSAVNDAINQGGNQYPIIPIPTDWTNPAPTAVAPFTPLPPIDFGNRDLLKGTQWEKFLSPTYGQLPKPVVYSQPSGMSYNDLMGILGNKQATLAKSNLTISDIISGIQSQYG